MDQTVGANGGPLVAVSEASPSPSACPADLVHPPMCCQGTTCYRWIDDPFRPCEPGFSAVSDAGRCCSAQDKRCDRPIAPPPLPVSVPPSVPPPDHPTTPPPPVSRPPVSLPPVPLPPPVAPPLPVTPPPPLPPPRLPPPALPPEGPKTWESYTFAYDRAFTDCAGGARYVAYDVRYSKWVGVELCSPTKYKIYLGEAKDGVFHEIGDFAGDGQDHCEIVNPTFTIPNEDEITSGGCASCASQMTWDNPGPVPVYTREWFGEAFTLETWPQYNLYTSRWYSCGVSIP